MRSPISCRAGSSAHLGSATTPDTSAASSALGTTTQTYVGGDAVNLVDPSGESLLGSLLNTAKGCVEGIVKGPDIRGGTYVIKIGTKVFWKTLPSGRVAGCVEGGIRQTVGLSSVRRI
jgi:hypothetical protein